MIPSSHRAQLHVNLMLQREGLPAREQLRRTRASHHVAEEASLRLVRTELSEAQAHTRAEEHAGRLVEAHVAHLITTRGER